LISLGYEETVGDVSGDSSGGEYCRICRNEDEHHKGDGVTVNVPGSVRVSPYNAKGKNMDVIAVPYVFRYLCAEMAAMGIKISVSVQ